MLLYDLCYISLKRVQYFIFKLLGYKYLGP